MNRILHVTNFLKQKMFYNNHVKFNFLGRLGRDELFTTTGDLLFPREQFPPMNTYTPRQVFPDD